MIRLGLEESQILFDLYSRFTHSYNLSEAKYVGKQIDEMRMRHGVEELNLSHKHEDMLFDQEFVANNFDAADYNTSLCIFYLDPLTPDHIKTYLRLKWGF